MPNDGKMNKGLHNMEAAIGVNIGQINKEYIIVVFIRVELKHEAIAVLKYNCLSFMATKGYT